MRSLSPPAGGGLDNADPGRPLVLRYPVARDLSDYRQVWSPSAPHRPDGALGALLASTRARVLRAAEAPASTAALGRRTGTSPATASHHATVLRTGGLLTSDRNGIGVRHTLTPLGRALLSDNPETSIQDREFSRHGLPGRVDD
ncbi:hypothetical protein ACIQKB_26015 [Streptomyces sp. NPDC092046]|uniref:hypothetical protein n=1 Tax=Streptomyces sp. NPDC092046 TaxID=3366009 RepID=UPI00382FC4C7